MSFSWFFGSKKKHSEQEETSESQNDKMDNFVFVERKLDQERPAPLYPPLPYALAPQTNQAVSISSNAAATNLMNSNFLHQVPFRISQDATIQVIGSLKQDTNMVKSIQSCINFLDLNAFDYDFQLERGVLNENDFRTAE